MGLVKQLLLKLINLYRLLKPPPSPCRFTPTCSVYAYQAIDKYGILKGGLLSLKRIFKCHPWSKGGIDALS